MRGKREDLEKWEMMKKEKNKKRNRENGEKIDG